MVQHTYGHQTSMEDRMSPQTPQEKREEVEATLKVLKDLARVTKFAQGYFSAVLKELKEAEDAKGGE